MTARNRYTAASFFALALTCLAAGPALAQPEAQPVTAESIAMSGSDSGSYRSKANDWMIMPDGTTTLGGSLRFVTAGEGFMADTPIAFTDIVLTNVAARHVLTRRLELHGSASFLPKQPSFTDELVWQSASLGARLGFGSRYALYATGQAGMMLGDTGSWNAGAAGVQGRKSLHRTLVVEGGVGGAYTGLFADGADAPSWVTEATASAQMIFREPRGNVAAWVGTEFRFPMVHHTAMDAGVAEYDPQTRVNFEIGGVLSYIDDWDIFAKYVVVDRGDAIDPTTTLPILEGGFDQQHLVIGLTHHWEGDPERPDELAIAE